MTFGPRSDAAPAPPKAKKPRNTSVPPDLAALRDLWQELRVEPWPKWTSTGTDRIHMWQSVKQFPLEQWRACLLRCTKIDGMKGLVPGKDGRVFILNPDMLLRSGTLVKVLEGGYDNWMKPKIPQGAAERQVPGAEDTKKLLGRKG